MYGSWQRIWFTDWTVPNFGNHSGQYQWKTNIVVVAAAAAAAGDITVSPVTVDADTCGMSAVDSASDRATV